LFDIEHDADELEAQMEADELAGEDRRRHQVRDFPWLVDLILR